MLYLIQNANLGLLLQLTHLSLTVSRQIQRAEIPWKPLDWKATYPKPVELFRESPREPSAGIGQVCRMHPIDKALAERVKKARQRVEKDKQKLSGITVKLNEQIQRGRRLAALSMRLRSESELFSNVARSLEKPLWTSCLMSCLGEKLYYAQTLLTA